MPRIACIQHGDYYDARARLQSGGVETYGSQRYSVEAQEKFLGYGPHLVVSLDGSASDRQSATGRYVCVPEPIIKGVPGRWRAQLRAARICRLLDAFAPTHILLRANDIVGCAILKWANKRGIPTAVIIAARFVANHPPSRLFCRLANNPNVHFVGNHNLVATRSLVNCGLEPAKAIAWDYPPRSHPDDHPVKNAPRLGPLGVLFAGNLIPDKGVEDLISAVDMARSLDLDMRLVICGDGPLRDQLSLHPGVRDGWLEIAGLVSSEEIAQRMLGSWTVVVPTRPNFPEALPLVIIEALASRTPLLLSDHPIFVEYFKSDSALDFFPAGNAQALSKCLVNLAADPSRYARHSAAAAQVWGGLQIPGRFHGLLDLFAQETGLAGSLA